MEVHAPNSAEVATPLGTPEQLRLTDPSDYIPAEKQIKHVKSLDTGKPKPWETTKKTGFGLIISENDHAVVAVGGSFSKDKKHGVLVFAQDKDKKEETSFEIEDFGHAKQDIICNALKNATTYLRNEQRYALAKKIGESADTLRAGTPAEVAQFCAVHLLGYLPDLRPAQEESLDFGSSAAKPSEVQRAELRDFSKFVSAKIPTNLQASIYVKLMKAAPNHPAAKFTSKSDATERSATINKLYTLGDYIFKLQDCGVVIHFGHNFCKGLFLATNS
ncbi:MAG: hypothetical protein A2782_01620 [Candidatus Blackburnbacteria bacterium RIFCSPHIGHO2_01_FULL_43_15b]|uniref:Uncharacterized protein n=1 Tax=Candidatus Blackburnbacteria bacterium RIFCSPHIGHO2_01_FULL_43_15b TaxID=1797513 RepID=A0A1G1UXJ4_9BACT|nr:MAG: hypothetical protein A2782_01620 [Candidatus Blackburnbacteria bacterium RIFCSPHIGHO2_01_FULL_43_15b]